MKKIHDLSYPIYFEHTLDVLKTYVFEHANNTNFYLITDENVSKLYTQQIQDTLPMIVGVVEVKAYESSKSLETYAFVTSELLSMGMKKNDGIIALGGGVVGDLSGFVASTLFRGVTYISIPTTLLAQVDSSVGSKVGINTLHGKNLIGAFKDPLFVFIYPKFLETLSQREFNNGLAEVIKAGLIKDPSILSDLKNNAPIETIIYKAVRVKVQVVLNDPFEKHERKILNFGHTLGHAIEKGFSYESIKHGEAISHGMVFAIQLGIRLGITPKEILEETLEILHTYHLLDVAINPVQAYVNDISFDKKSNQLGVDFIFLTGFGNTIIKHISFGDLYVD